MRKFIIAFLFVPSTLAAQQVRIPGPGGKAPSSATIFTFVTSANSGNCTSSPCNATISPTAGHLLVIDYGVEHTGGAPTVTGTDSASDSFSVSVQDTTTLTSNNMYFGEFYLCVVSSGVTTAGFTSTGATNGVAVVREYSYTGTCHGKDQVSSVGTGTGTAITGGSVTTATANEMLGGPIVQVGAQQVITPTGSWHDRGDVGFGAGSNLTFSAEDQIVTMTGTYALGATVASSVIWGAYTVSYK